MNGGAIMKSIIVLFLSTLMICTLTTVHAQDDAAQRLYQEGIFQMEGMGNFSAAIELFEKLVLDFPENKPLASRALLMTGRCHEKLGRQEAAQVYNRILEEYTDQDEIVNEARARLLALTERALPEHSDMIVRRVWQGHDACALSNISPDGNYVTYTDWTTGDLALFELSTGQARRLTNKGPLSESDQHALYPVFSHDGKYIAYTWYDENNEYGLRMFDLESERVQVLLDDKSFIYVQALEWSPDGSGIILLTKESFEETRLSHYFVEQDTLSLLKLFDEYFFPTKIAFSPDAKYIAYDHYAGKMGNWLNIYIIDLETKEQYELVSHPSGNMVCGWTPDGTQLLFISDRTGVNAIWAVEVKEGKLAGAPQIIKTEISQAITPIRLTQNTSFYFGIDSGSRDVYTAAFNPEQAEPFGPPEKISRQYEGLNRTPAWSNDGRFIAYTATRNQRHIYHSNAVIIHDVETGLERSIVLDVRMIFDFIKWSPDDQSIAISTTFLEDLQELRGLFILNVATGLITDTIKEKWEIGLFTQPAWSEDGKYLYYFRRDQTDLSYVLMERDMMTGQEKALFELSGNYEWPLIELVYSSGDDMLVFSLSSMIEKRSDLFISELNDGDPTPHSLLTTKYPEVIKRALSFDEKEVVFLKSRMDEKNNQHNFELWSINIFSRESRKIAAIPDDFLNISFHPDGKTSVFNMGLRNNPCEIWAIDNLLP